LSGNEDLRVDCDSGSWAEAVFVVAVSLMPVF